MLEIKHAFNDALDLADEARKLLSADEAGYTYFIPLYRTAVDGQLPAADRLVRIPEDRATGLKGKLGGVIKRTVQKLVRRHLVAQAEFNAVLRDHVHADRATLRVIDSYFRQLQDHLRAEREARRALEARIAVLEGELARRA